MEDARLPDMSRIVLYSDLDGTLFNRSTQIPERNRAALERFVRCGGTLGIATGRPWSNAKPLLGELPVTAPSIFLNGAILSDPATGRVIQSFDLAHDAAEQVASLCLEAYPSVDVQVYDDNSILYVSPREKADMDWVEKHKPCQFLTLQAVRQRRWRKLLLLGQPEELRQLFGALEKTPWRESLDFVFSAPHLLEVLPRGVNKGKMLKAVRKQLGARKLLCAIGDFDNDAEMLMEADVSAAPQNGTLRAKAVAKHSVCDCDSGAVADFLDSLERIGRI